MSASHSVNAAKKGPSFLQKNNKLWLWVTVALGLITTLCLFLFLQTLSATTTYAVLQQDVPARTLITEDMVGEIIVSEGGQPPSALPLSDILSGETYTRFSLEYGDVLTSSNTGPLTALTEGLPSNYNVASFRAVPSDAAGGNIQRGDYIDLFVLAESDQGIESKLLLQRVLVLTATDDVDGGSPGEATEGENPTAAYQSGVPVIYTVGVTQEDAAKLSLASRYVLYPTLSSADSVKNGAQDSSLILDLPTLRDMVSGDAGVGTDSNFELVAPEEEETPAPVEEGSEATENPEELTDEAPVDEAPVEEGEAPVTE